MMLWNMTTEEALRFLARHQPLPPENELDEQTIATYDEVRKHFLDVYDERCVDLFLGSFGEGMGLGVYQLVDEVLRKYPHDLVVLSLDRHLCSSHSGVRFWCLQVATIFPDYTLRPHFKRLVLSGDVDESLFAAQNIALTAREEDRGFVQALLRRDLDPEVRQILKDWTYSTL